MVLFFKDNEAKKKQRNDKTCRWQICDSDCQRLPFPSTVNCPLSAYFQNSFQMQELYLSGLVARCAKNSAITICSIIYVILIYWMKSLDQYSKTWLFLSWLTQSTILHQNSKNSCAIAYPSFPLVHYCSNYWSLFLVHAVFLNWLCNHWINNLRLSYPPIDCKRFTQRKIKQVEENN